MAAAASVGVIVLLAVGSICVELVSGRVSRMISLAVPGFSGESSGSATDGDQRLRRAAVGTWQDFYHGKRTMTLGVDGKATMRVELTGIKARLFTPRLDLDIVWSVEDGRMHRRTIGGRPADKVEFVNKRAGVVVAERILELSADKMVLLDQNGSQKYTWRRVK